MDRRSASDVARPAAAFRPHGSRRVTETAVSETRPASGGLVTRHRRVLIILLLAIPLVVGLVIRGSRLKQIADGPEPFDLEAVRHVDVAPENNAYLDYARGIAYLARPGEGGKRLPEDNPESLHLFLVGSRRSDALYHQPGELHSNVDWQVTNSLRELSRLAHEQGRELERAGPLSEAWQWHRAGLRASRHPGMHGAVIERLTGEALHAVACAEIARWAAHPQLDAVALRQALADVREIDRLTTPLSTNLKSEYLLIANSLEDPRLMGGMPGTATSLPQRLLSSLSAEPAASRAVIKRVFANFLRECDKLPSERAKMAAGGFFERDAASAEEPDPEELAKVVSKTVFASQALPALTQALHARDRQLARQALLELALLLEIHYREHGGFPEKLESLVGPDLAEVPSDPFRAGAPLNYRMESDPADGVTIWSVGPDGTDDGGKIHSTHADLARKDVTLQVKPPTP